MPPGVRPLEVAALLGVGLTTLQRLQREYAGDEVGVDRRKGNHCLISHRLSEKDKLRFLLTCHQKEFAALPTVQILPMHFRHLHYKSQMDHRGQSKPAQAYQPVPKMKARSRNQAWSKRNTYLPTSERDTWLYLYLVGNVWSR